MVQEQTKLLLVVYCRLNLSDRLNEISLKYGIKQDI